MLGGGMRQAGVSPPPGFYALNHHVDRASRRITRARGNSPMRSDDLAVFAGRSAARPTWFSSNSRRDELAALTKHFEKRQIRIRGPRWVLHLDVDDDGVAAHASTPRAPFQPGGE